MLKLRGMLITLTITLSVRILIFYFIGSALHGMLPVDVSKY
jgi:hypothetical protein